MAMCNGLTGCEREWAVRDGRDTSPLRSLSYAACMAFALLFVACSPDMAVHDESVQGGGGGAVIRFSIVCVIHGDGNYLYHDTSGNDHMADEEALAGMKVVAERNPLAEVMVFHQKQARTEWLFFPQRDGEFFCYRGGRLVAHETYWRDQERSHLAPEGALFDRFHTARNPGTVAFFLYYGHEIPECGGDGYDASYPDRPFTVRDLSKGLEGFMGGIGRFDLMILSTCYGGTPYTIGALGTSARTIIASPDNLHLSYFALQALENLDSTLTRGDVPGLATRFARHAFDRLGAQAQTTVSVAVYDADVVRDYVSTVGEKYQATLTEVERMKEASVLGMEHCDCADVPGYTYPAMDRGVSILFRPPAFGRAREAEHHSGWECWREVPATATR
jgi:hypothetical protein